MNSFDLMMERYKKELVDANRRSIEQELLSQSEERESDAADLFPDPEESEADAAVTVNAEAQTDTEPESGMDEDAAPVMKSDAQDPMKAETKTADPETEADSFGTLKVQVFAAQQVYPISAARVIVRRHGEDQIIFEDYTDSSGIVDNIRLPTPGKSLSSAPNSIKPYSQYDVFVTQPNFVSRNYLGVPVFSGVESIQTVRLVPKQFGTDTTTVTTESEPNELLIQEKGEG